MKYETKEAFEAANAFGTGEPNTAYARFFQGDSFLNLLTDPKSGLFAANVTFAPGCFCPVLYREFLFKSSDQAGGKHRGFGKRHL